MTRETKTITVVQCVFFDEELPALPRPPFPGELGQRIYENISKLAYAQWQERATLVINHYGLNLADPNAQEMLFNEMESFLFGGEGGAAISGAPAGKGAPRK